MPRCPVKQPNGKMAVWSTIVDDFTDYDCDAIELVQVLRRGPQTYTPAEIGQALANIADNGKAWRWAPDFDGAMETIRAIHGDEKHAERVAMFEEGTATK